MTIAIKLSSQIRDVEVGFLAQVQVICQSEFQGTILAKGEQFPEVTDIAYQVMTIIFSEPVIDIQDPVVGQPLIKVFRQQSTNSNYVVSVDQDLIIVIVGVSHRAPIVTHQAAYP